MAAQICIKMARGTFFQLVNTTNRFLRFFQAKYTDKRYIFEDAREPYFSIIPYQSKVTIFF